MAFWQRLPHAASNSLPEWPLQIAGWCTALPAAVPGRHCWTLGWSAQWCLQSARIDQTASNRLVGTTASE